MITDKESLEEQKTFKPIKSQAQKRSSKNMQLINQIENDQAPYFGLNAKHHQHEDAYGTKMANIENDVKSEVDDNFKVARQISYDLSSEFRGCTPRQEGLIENWARIGEPDLVQFSNSEEKEKESSEEDESSDDETSSEEEESSEDVLSPSQTVSKSKTDQT